MYCNKCGKEISDEALICPYCGCGTVNYIRDQAKAEARVQVQAAPARKSARLLCCFAFSWWPWGAPVLCRQDLDGASLALYARLLGHWHAG